MFSKQGELDLARVLKALIDAGDIEPRPGFRGGQLVDHGPSGVRQGYAKQAWNKGIKGTTRSASEWDIRGMARAMPVEALERIKELYLKNYFNKEIERKVMLEFPAGKRAGYSSVNIRGIIDRLKKEDIRGIKKITANEIKDISNWIRLEGKQTSFTPPRKTKIGTTGERIHSSQFIKDVKTHSRKDFITGKNLPYKMSGTTLARERNKYKVEFGKLAARGAHFKPEVTKNIKKLQNLLLKNPKLSAAELFKKSGLTHHQYGSAIQGFKTSYKPTIAGQRPDFTPDPKLKAKISKLPLHFPMPHEQFLRKLKIEPESIRQIERVRKGVTGFFPGAGYWKGKGTHFEHTFPKLLIDYFDDKDLRRTLYMTGSRTTPEFNMFKKKYDFKSQQAVEKFLADKITLEEYNKRIKNIRNTVKEVSGGYEMGYIKFDKNKIPTAIVNAKTTEQGTRALGPESTQRLKTFENIKYHNNIIKKFKHNPNHKWFETLRGEGFVPENTRLYSNYETAYNKIKPYLNSRENIIKFAKKNLNNPIVRGLFKKPWGTAVAALTGAAILPTALAADTGAPKDEVTKSGMKMPTIGQTAAAAALSKISGKFGGADPLKYLRKVPRKILSSLATPTGALAAWPLAAWGTEKLTGEEIPAFDPKSGIERAAAGSELAFAPTLVSWTDKLTKPIKNKAVRSGVTQLLNLGMSPAMAMRVARVASPIGMASLLGEVTYQGGKAIMSESKRIDEIKDPELQEVETENFIRNIKGYAGGGLTRTVAPDSGPVSRGLRSLYIDDMD